MIGLAAVVTGVLFAVATYLMLSRNVQRMAIGFIVLSNGANLMVLTASGLPARAMPPVIETEEQAAALMANPLAYVSDPLPQAFILTAIVIGLGSAAFLLAMAARTHRETGSDKLKETSWD